MMVRNRRLTIGREPVDRHNPYELHHSPIFVAEDVAVKDVGAGEIDELMTDRHAARRKALYQRRRAGYRQCQSRRK